MRKSGYIIVEGNIGVGKSTFTKLIVDELARVGCRSEYLPEPDEQNNNFLPLYYSNPKQYSYSMQMHLLHQRFRDTNFAAAGALADKGWFVMDRSYFGDLCFANVQRKLGYFTDFEFNSYVTAHRNMERIPFPTVAIFLKAAPETCKKRISKRMTEKAGRACESTIDIEYLANLQKEIDGLEEFMEKTSNVISLDWNDDLNSEQLSELAKEIVGKIVNCTDTKLNFYSPWGACANALFSSEVCEHD